MNQIESEVSFVVLMVILSMRFCKNAVDLLLLGNGIRASEPLHYGEPEPQACIAMDDDHTLDETMSESQVESLRAEIKATLNTARWFIGGIGGALVIIITTFGLLFYQQGSEQHDSLIKLSQKVEDLPKSDNTESTEIKVDTERISTLEKVAQQQDERLNLQGNVMNHLQQEFDQLSAHQPGR